MNVSRDIGIAHILDQINERQGILKNKEMKLQVEIENVKAVEEILEKTNRTSSEIVNAFFQALHETLDITSSRDWFGNAPFDDVLDCILNNLSVGPKIIEDTNKGILFRNHLKSKIDQLEVDFEKGQFWYELNNFDDKKDPIMSKIEVGKHGISLSRTGAVQVPATAVKDLHKRVMDAKQLTREFVKDSKYLQHTTNEVKLKIISEHMTPAFISVTLIVNAEERRYLPKLDALNFLIRGLSGIVWETLTK